MMQGRGPKKAAKAPSPRQARKKKTTKSAIPPPEMEIEVRPAQRPLREPSPEELQELEVSLDHEEAREQALGLGREYPRADLALVNPLTAALKGVAGLNSVKARVIAQGLKRIGDKAHDLNEILERMVREDHSPEEVAELVMAFHLVTEHLSTYVDSQGTKLVELFDRAKGLE
jgi:hypothetical protein